MKYLLNTDMMCALGIDNMKEWATYFYCDPCINGKHLTKRKSKAVLFVDEDEAEAYAKAHNLPLFNGDEPVSDTNNTQVRFTICYLFKNEIEEDRHV